MSARAEPRFTRDVDLAVHVLGDDDAERLVRDLQTRHYRARAIVEHEATGRLATVRLLPPEEDEAGVVADLLFASSGIEPEIVDAAETVEVLPGLRVPIATIGHLIALKILSMDDRTRPQDRMDLRALIAAATADDIRLARAAAEAITLRGFHRGRDLAGTLDRLVVTESGQGS